MARRTTIWYDREQDRWCVELGARSYPLHCGEFFLLYMGKTAFPCRLELDTSWYVVMRETTFALHTSTVYTVSI